MTRLLRVLSLVLLAALGTVVLMRLAPGFFTDANELDPQYAAAARDRLETQQTSTPALIKTLVKGWLHADFGQSRQYEVPVTTLLAPRIRVTARLLLTGVALGWLTALALALPLGLRRGSTAEPAITAATVLFLTLPVGALATACLLLNCGGPTAVLATLIAARDFKLVYRLLRIARTAPHLVFARAQGIHPTRLVLAHLLPTIAPQVFSIAIVSFVTALSAIVPVEVIFDTPGLGQLAWSAAINRDLPVLLTVTLIMAAAVGLLTATAPTRPVEVTA